MYAYMSLPLTRMYVYMCHACLEHAVHIGIVRCFWSRMCTWAQTLSSYSDHGSQVWTDSERSRILKISRFREISTFGRNLGFWPKSWIFGILARIAVRSTFRPFLARIAVLAGLADLAVRTVRPWLRTCQILESPEFRDFGGSDLANLVPGCYI